MSDTHNRVCRMRVVCVCLCPKGLNFEIIVDGIKQFICVFYENRGNGITYTPQVLNLPYTSSSKSKSIETT